MNCAQHSDLPAVAFCRTCGKPLCEGCKRDVQGTIFCEPCLAARVHGAEPVPGAGVPPYGAPPVGAPGGYGVPPVNPPENASPGLALFLGFIPGVGAFYNGQFLKGFVHVIVLATLIWLSDHGMGDFAGLMIAAWIFYMVFDAYVTAKARRYGMPIPDPLGLNHILEGREGTFRDRVEQAGERLGTRMESAAQEMNQRWQQAGGATPGARATNFNAANGPAPGAASNPAGSAPGGTAPGSASADPGAHDDLGGAVRDAAKAAVNAATTAANFANDRIREAQNKANFQQPGAFHNGPQGTYYNGPDGTYYNGPQGAYYAPPEPPKPRNSSPVGAVVLIGLGMIFLLANLGWFSIHWLSNLWPLILVACGVWIFVQRQQRGKH
ncbi:MAG: B-box zinc finger protein [Acidobacteriota bacterium]|nr:B-box zinc finger protein [Acidobacteriota bacterium]